MIDYWFGKKSENTSVETKYDFAIVNFVFAVLAAVARFAVTSIRAR